MDTYEAWRFIWGSDSPMHIFAKSLIRTPSQAYPFLSQGDPVNAKVHIQDWIADVPTHFRAYDEFGNKLVVYMPSTTSPLALHSCVYLRRFVFIKHDNRVTYISTSAASVIMVPTPNCMKYSVELCGGHW